MSWHNLFSVFLKTIEHLNLILSIYFEGVLQVLGYDSKVEEFRNFDLTPIYYSKICLKGPLKYRQNQGFNEKW